jgi:hypothetical protein
MCVSLIPFEPDEDDDVFDEDEHDDDEYVECLLPDAVVVVVIACCLFVGNELFGLFIDVELLDVKEHVDEAELLLGVCITHISASD